MGLLLMLPLCGFAQKGMQGVGVNFGFGCCFAYGDYASSYGINYQNFVTDRFRLVSSLEVLDYTYEGMWHSYYDEDVLASSYLLVVEGHYFFNDIRRLRPYVVGGVSVGFLETTGGWYNDYGHYSEPISEFAGGVKLGVGLNYRISYHLTAQLEVPIHLVYYNPLFTPSLGLVYTF